MEKLDEQEGSLKNDWPSLETYELKQNLYHEKYNSAATIRHNYPCKKDTQKVKVTHQWMWSGHILSSFYPFTNRNNRFKAITDLATKTGIFNG